MTRSHHTPRVVRLEFKIMFLVLTSSYGINFNWLFVSWFLNHVTYCVHKKCCNIAIVNPLCSSYSAMHSVRECIVYL